MPPEVIDTRALAAAVTAAYDNRPIATADDHVVRLSVMTKPYFWHSHDRDEAFLVLEGGLEIGFADDVVVLGEGQMVSVPAGVVHRTRPVGARSVNLTFEHAAALTLPADRPAGATEELR